MRALAVSPRHLTGETTEALLARLGVKDPVCMVATLARTQGERLRQFVATQDVMTTHMSEQAEWSLEQWQLQLKNDTRSHMRLQRLEQSGDGWPCPHCGVYFISELAVTTHIGHQHAELHKQVREEVGEMQAADMGVDGMPTCRFCLTKFHSWQTLKRHVLLGRCGAMHATIKAGGTVLPRVSGSAEEAAAETPADADKSRPLLRQHALLQRLVDQQLACELFAAEIRDQIIQNCAICGQWIADARQVKQHIRQSHKDIWDKHHTAIDDLCAVFGRAVTVPCGYCGTDKINSSNISRHAKLCGVLFQTLLVLRIAQQEGHVRSGDGCFPPPPPQRGRRSAANGRRGKTRIPSGQRWRKD